MEIENMDKTKPEDFYYAEKTSLEDIAPEHWDLFLRFRQLRAMEELASLEDDKKDWMAIFTGYFIAITSWVVYIVLF